jgi:hypothetical protein
MTNFLSGYSIQKWLESCPQGYLEDTVYGHEAGEHEPGEIIDNEVLREGQIRSSISASVRRTWNQRLMNLVIRIL